MTIGPSFGAGLNPILTTGATLRAQANFVATWASKQEGEKFTDNNDKPQDK